MTTDSGQTVKEYDSNGNPAYGNNSASVSTTSTLANYPDLAVTATSAPSSGALDTTIPVSWTVTNLSPDGTAKESWTDQVYLSTHSVLDSSAIALLSPAASGQSPLAPQASYTRNVSVLIPTDIATGNYFLLFVADANGGQYESATGNDTNDLVADPITLNAPDLEVTSVSGPASSFTSQNVLVTWTDTNNGTATATGPWKDEVYLATDAQGDNPAPLATLTYAGSLAAGATISLTQEVALPSTPGSYWFVVTTDVGQVIPEGTNYDNETTVASTPIAVAQAPLPDLVVTSLTAPGNGVLSGTSVPISFVVYNQGTAPRRCRFGRIG